LKRLLGICGLLCLLAGLAAAQDANTLAQTVLIVPFENVSKSTGLEWIGESFPEVIAQRMQHPAVYMVPREDRLYAYDRAGIPASVRPSHVTLYRIAEQMDADYLILGRYDFDGRSFLATAQVLDLKRLRLSSEITESGPLPSLIEIQDALAWDLLRAVRPDFNVARADFLHGSPAIRLDAFEAYIRGLSTPARQDKIRFFREAVRLNPAYTLALLHLGRAYFHGHDYEAAAAALSRIPHTDPLAREASFWAGLAYLSAGDLEHAESSFTFLASQFPLPDVYNNLAVVLHRRGKSTAADYLEKAIAADPRDPDYHFNLALIDYRHGDMAEASRQLRETLAIQPTDLDARLLLEHINARSPLPASRLPQERLKREYNENSFRQLAFLIRNVAEERMAHADPKTHAAFHVEHGHQLLEQGFAGEAAVDFREAATLDPVNSGAHAGLAAVLLSAGDLAGARREANQSLKIQPNAEAHLLLARVDLEENHLQAAATDVEFALVLEPDNAGAQALKRDIAARLQGAGTASPKER
jgi:Flp pilus assembly protein TadD/TolB-like protein